MTAVRAVWVQYVILCGAKVEELHLANASFFLSLRFRLV